MEQSQLIQILDFALVECRDGEMPWCEFKQNFHTSEELGKDISAIANISRIHGRPDGYIIFGVEPNMHTPVGTTFNPQVQKGKGNEDLIPWLHRQLGGFSGFDFFEIIDYLGTTRMVICIIQASQINPIVFENMAYIRIGTSTKPLKDSKILESKLWESLLMSSFDTDLVYTMIEKNKILDLIDWQGYIETMKYEPVTEDTAIEKLLQDNLIICRDGLFDITNACALLFARDLAEFSLKSKSPRVITYRGNNKLHATNDQKGSKGYAIAFPGLINYIFSQIPKIEIIEASRTDEPGYPKVALREFIANAIIHQDFRSTGSEVLIEIYDDRIEISNPGIPLIEIDRFVDHPPKSRNEVLADFMRRAGHCERRGSGVDRALEAIQIAKLPNPKIERSSDFTRITLYRTRPIIRLTNDEKAQAVYWHCVLTYVLKSNEPMTNPSVCERFGIAEQNSSIASRLIKLAKDEGKIKPFDPKSKTRKHAKYIPFWVN